MNKILPKIEKASIIVYILSKQGARTKFPFKKKGLTKLYIINNFISLNKQTIKYAYPIYLIDKILNLVLNP